MVDVHAHVLAILRGDAPWLPFVVAGLIAVEGAALRVAGRRIDWREEFASWAVGIGYFVVAVAGGRILFYALYREVFARLRVFEFSATSPWSWLALLVIGDFVYYWVHRMEHRVRLFWAVHENHHSARTFTFGTAVRMPWAEVLYHPLLGLWAPLLGFPPAMLPLMEAFNLLGGLVQHTELVGRLGPLEWIFATPSHHRVHHGSDAGYLDCNYGARFIVWDRLFGTFVPETSRPTYGLVKNVESHNPFAIVAHGPRALVRDMAKAGSLREAIRVCAKPPEWTPPHRSS